MSEALARVACVLGADGLPAVGDEIRTWFSGRPNGMSRVLAIRPYQGRYSQWYTHVIQASAAATDRGWMEFAYQAGDRL